MTLISAGLRCTVNEFSVDVAFYDSISRRVEANLEITFNYALVGKSVYCSSQCMPTRQDTSKNVVLAASRWGDAAFYIQFSFERRWSSHQSTTCCSQISYVLHHHQFYPPQTIHLESGTRGQEVLRSGSEKSTCLHIAARSLLIFRTRAALCYSILINSSTQVFQHGWP
jgi:hypothetical protein